MTKKRCDNCRYWSEQIAASNEAQEVTAMCLADGSIFRLTFTAGRHSCKAHASNELGAVDRPRSNPLRYEEAEANA